MTEDQLFEWETKPKRARRKPEQTLIDRPRTYMAIATRRQGPTFHRVRYIEREHATHIAWCGLKGHRVNDSAKKVPECAECEKAFIAHHERDGMEASPQVDDT